MYICIYVCMYTCIRVYMYICIYVLYVCMYMCSQKCTNNIVAIFYPFSQFCEINISLLSLQTQPNTAPNLFQRGVEYGKYE